MKEMKVRAKRAWGVYVTLWERTTGWRSFLFFTAHYTMLFLFMSWFVFAPFRREGTTFIFASDGMASYFTNLLYLSQTVRDGLQSLLVGDGWTIPLYDFWTGTAKLRLEMEPIQWLAILCPWDRLDVLYDVLVLVRYYLVGLSFSALGYYFKQKPFPILISAVSYTFCGYSIYAGIRHPHFLLPMMLLPILVIGAEKILKKERPFLLIAMVFLTVIFRLYFACILAIIVFLYILVRFPVYYQEKRGQEFLGLIGRLMLAGGIGIALGGITMIPSAIQMLDTGRIGRNVTVYNSLTTYAASYYKKFLTNFIQVETRTIGGWTCLGFSVLSLPAVLLLFVRRRKEERSLRLLFVLSTVMLLIPAVAYVMSGFNATSNRWCFAYALCVCAILMFESAHFEEMNNATLCFLGIGVLFYILICYVVSSEVYRANATIFLVISVLLVWICWYLHRWGYRIMFPVCLAVTCITICYGAFLEYDPKQGDYVSLYVEKETAYQSYKESQYGSFSKSKVSDLEQPFYRVAGNAISRSTLGGSFYYGIHGLTSYSSFRYPSFIQWLQEQELPGGSTNNRISDVQTRAHILTLSGVKYYVLQEGKRKIEPYGFQEIERVQRTKGMIDIIMENQYALPLGYTYDDYFFREAYEQLSALDRQNVQIQALVLDEIPRSSNITKAVIQPEAQRIPVSITGKENLNWKNGKLKVTQEGATLTLEFKGVSQTETYLRVVGLDLTSGNSSRRWDLAVTTGSTSTSAHFAADGYIYSNGMKTQLIDLGYTEDGFTTCTLTFPAKGTFKLEDLEIWCQPMDSYGERINALREEALENVETNWRGVTGTISVSRDKMLCIALPYDSGWSAYVDGERVKLYQANTAFMAVELSPGDHQIELKYWTPGLTAGIALTCAGVAGLIILVVWQRKDRKKAGQRDVEI